MPGDVQSYISISLKNTVRSVPYGETLLMMLRLLKLINHGSRIMTNNVNRRFPHQLMHSAKGIAALLKPFNRSMFAQIYVNLLQ